MKTNTKIILSLASFCLMSSCNYQVEKSPASGGFAAQQLNSFDAIKLNLLDPKCLRCHGVNPSAGVNLSTYKTIMATAGLVNVGHRASSLLYTEVESGSMPENSPHLSTSEVASIGDWIDSGAPDGKFTSTEPVPTPPPTPTPPVTPLPPQPLPISYSQIQTKIFDVSCVRCHEGTKPSGNVDLSNYQKLMANTKKVIIVGSAAKSLAYTEIAGGSMPPKGAKIDATLILLLKDWINAGAKNN